MFPTFISIIDIQSWWEVPSIAHFCSLFRTAFNLLDFDIEDLEEALLTDGTEESSWLQDLIVRLLSGCLPNNEISTFNYQMFLRRLFRQKCQEHDRYNPFNTDIDFQLLPLRTKVDILHALCDFRLDADDVFDQLKNLEADSLRVEPLGYDSNGSAYWYFYGTRLYREDGQSKNNKKSVWQVICFTEDDWYQLTKKFKKSINKQEKQLYQTLNENFLPDLPRLFKEKENLARKRLLENLPRRTSSRIKKLEEEAEKESSKVQHQKVLEVERKQQQRKEEENINIKVDLGKRRQEAYERRAKLKEQSEEDSFSDRSIERDEMAKYKSRKSKGRQRKISTSPSTRRDDSPKNSKKNKKHQKEIDSSSKSSVATTKVGRQTNNSLSAATGQILIQPQPNSNKKRLKTSQVFRQTDEDLQTGMHKILDYVKNHEDAWPFVDPVEEEYAPNYYSVIRKPMDLQRMEERLDSGYYKSFAKFRSDFQLIVDNCRLYNGVENEYTEMVDNLSKVFERATEKYLDMISSSDDEIAIEYSSSESKNNSKKTSDELPSTYLTSKRKPMLVAQTDTKRERSVSEASDNSRTTFEDNENVEKSTNKTDKNVRKQKKLAKIKNQKLMKKQKNTPKAEKNDVQVKKEKYEIKKEKSESRKETPMESKDKNFHKKSSKAGKSKSRKSLKKQKKKIALRSRSNSSTKSDFGSLPPSWPASPDERFNFIPEENSRKRSSKYSNDSDDSSIGKKNKIAKYENKDDDDLVLPDENKAKGFDKISLSPKPKDKHNKLRETIEKLKAKSEIKLTDEFHFELDLSKENKDKNRKHEKESEDKKVIKNNDKVVNKTSKNDVYLELEGNSTMDSNTSESRNSKNISKNTMTLTKPSNLDALTIATEQTLKDINKWLDDTPKFSEFSSASNSPSYIGCEELETLPGKNDPNVVKKIEKPSNTKKENTTKDHKKRVVRDSNKFLKKREVQRTIDRLQPGKSKGNLITNVQNANKAEEIFPLGPLSKIKDTKNSLIVKTDTNAPKLSLGSVLDSFGKHNFVDDQKKEDQKILAEIPKENTSVNFHDLDKLEKEFDLLKKEDKTEKTESEVIEEVNSIGEATPNLSAWFKAFGAPKVQSVPKKNELKPDGKENEKVDESNIKMMKVPTPINSPNTDGIIIPHAQPIQRQRRISTGSSMSERSSFSQDMDSPRVGMDERGAYPAPYPSPLHRSPSGASPVMASPRPDISPKATNYPPINGQIRCGFYQDTVSNKSSPDKSCSPRENPQSPYPHYSEHVYTPNTENSYYSYANSPYYTHAPNYSNTNPTPPYNTDGSRSYYDANKSITEQYLTKTGYTVNSPASNHSSPAHPQHSPSLVLSPHSPSIHSPSIHSPHSPNVHSPHSPNIHSPHSPTIHSQHSPSVNQHSPNVQLQHSPTFHSQQSPTPQPSPGFHSQPSPIGPAPHSPIHSSTLPINDAMNLPLVRESANSSLHSPIPAKAESNISEPEKLEKIENEITDRSFQQTTQGAIFPVKKRAYNENDLPKINNQRYEIDPKLAQRQNHSLTEGSHNTILKESKFKIYSNRNDSSNTFSNSDTRNSPNINTSSTITESIQSEAKGTHEIFSGTKFSNPYLSSFGKEAICPPNTTNLNSTPNSQQNMMEMSKFTNMGYTGVEMNYSKSALQYSHTSTDTITSLPTETSQKPSPIQIKSSEIQQIEIPRICPPNAASNQQRYKSSSINIHQTTPQDSHGTFTTSTRSSNVQNVTCSYKSDVSVPKSAYNTSSIDMDQPLGLNRSAASFSHLVERYSDERLLTGLQTSSFYTDKGLGTSQLFNKPISSNAPNLSVFNQADMAAMQQCYNQNIQGSSSMYNRPMVDIQNSNSIQGDQKPSLQNQMQDKKKKRKSSKVVATSSETQQTSSQHQGFQSYAGLKGNSTIEPNAISLKTSSVVPGSAFNFGPTPSALGISPSLYSDKDAYPNFLEDFRSAPNYYMAAAAHHRSNTESTGEKQARVAHQSSNPQTTPSYPFLSASPQTRSTYPIGGPFISNAAQAAQLMDASSPLYQHYLQTGVLNQGLLGPPGAYPPGYHPALSIRQPYDSMSRPSWL